MRVLIAPDKFKGTLTARQAAMAIARGWRNARPKDKLALLPICDGGDGFGSTMGKLLGAKRQRVATVNAAHEKITAAWWWEPRTRTALIESAAIIGLAMLPPGKFHPFTLDTFGLGKALLTAQRKGARRIILGIGGSATNDGGFGMARALDWKFKDQAGNELTRWTDLKNLAQVERGECLPGIQVAVAVDVQNPLLGPRGAIRIYGPQKGLRPQDFRAAELCLGRLAKAMQRKPGTNHALIPGAGAAGGLGFGLMAFVGARLESGFELFATQAHLDQCLRQAELVVTGEGAIDVSTTHGKGVGELARRCQRLGVTCIGLGGIVQSTPETRRLFSATAALTDSTTKAHARRAPALWLARTAQKYAANLVCKLAPPR